MFHTSLYNVFKLKLYRSTLVTAVTLASFMANICNAINYEISDIDFGYVNSKSFDFEGMDDPRYNLDEINEIDEALNHLQGNDPETLSKSCFSNLKKFVVKKILLKYVKEFTSLSPREKTHVMGKKLRSFRKFVSKVSGKKISKEDLYKSFKKKAKQLNFPIEVSKYKHLFFYHKESHPIAKGSPISKGAYPTFEDDEEEAQGMLYLGCVLVACGTLVGTIPFAFPPAGPLCYAVSGVLMNVGGCCIHDGLSKGRDLKKKY
jgi:hypothetical protein